MLFIILFLMFTTIFFIAYLVIPMVYEKATVISEKRQKNLSANFQQLLPTNQAKKMSRFFVFAPFLFGAALYFLFPEGLRVFGLIIGATGGYLFPKVYIQIMTRQIKEKFKDQLIDALMIMSSSFRGGLSLIQAFEAVVEEMPNPINTEFSSVLGENMMGVTLEDALYHLYNRMPSAALQQMITAILLARETGGNLPLIFSRIVTNIRESKKIQQNLSTLTIQGKLQGVVMTLLPLGFAFIVYSSNKRIFEHMFTTDLGRSMLIYAVISEIIGAFLIIKISSFKDF